MAVTGVGNRIARRPVPAATASCVRPLHHQRHVGESKLGSCSGRIRKQRGGCFPGPKAARGEAGADPEEVKRLSAENAELRARIKELEAFIEREEAFHVASAEAAVEQQLPGAVEVAAEPVDFDSIPLPTPSDEKLFWESIPVRTLSATSGSGGAPAKPDGFKLNVVHLTAEMAPLAKVGGLGDVVTGLARSCTARGHDIEIILPFYECIDEDLLEDFKFEFDFDCPKGHEWNGSFQVGSLKTQVFTATCEGIKMVLLRPDWGGDCNIFKGGRVYAGSYNETEAYLYFCRAGLEFLKVSGRQPDVIHLHEWQTSAAAMLYWEIYNKDGLHKPRVVLTIHNMDNTGECRAEEFTATGMSGDAFNTVEKALDERTIGHNPERLSLLKGGVVYSNAVTTVSPTYAVETSTGGGGWLSGTLAEYQQKYHGILNGIDDVMWDPSSDLYLPCAFSKDDLSGKYFLQRYLRSGLGLEDPASDDGSGNNRKPLVVCITRLVPQKGIHLIRHAIWQTVKQGGQFVLLGSGHADGDFRHLAENDFKDHDQVKLILGYSEALSHFLFAAADIVLVPSIFEPCGLTQMIGMRYGALPVVRRTGGLADTVEDEVTGFTFDGTDEGSLDVALNKAIDWHRTRASKWEEIAVSNMAIDFGWSRSATMYLDLYRSL